MGKLVSGEFNLHTHQLPNLPIHYLTPTASSRYSLFISATYSALPSGSTKCAKLPALPSPMIGSENVTPRASSALTDSLMLPVRYSPMDMPLLRSPAGV